MLSSSDSEHTEGTGLEDTETNSFMGLDDSLTNLEWLQEFSILSEEVPQDVHQQTGSCGLTGSPLAQNLALIDLPPTPRKSTIDMMQTLPGIVAHGHSPDEVDYKTNAHVKPVYSYAKLIYMAMQASKNSKITVSSIYKWITDNFCYYRYAEPSWRNSVRHNLSLNKCFIKVPREKGEPGKGGFWKIDPQYVEHILKGDYKRRRMPLVHINSARQKRLQVDLPLPASSNMGLRMNMESQQMNKEEQDWDTCLWSGGGYKKKHSLGSRYGVKVSQQSSPPLMYAEEQKETGPLKGHLSWDSLLDSAHSGGLSLNEGNHLNPNIKDDDLMARSTYISPFGAPSGMANQNGSVSDFFEETLLATAFLETSWPEEVGHGQGDLCSSRVNLEQLIDLGGSLNLEENTVVDTPLGRTSFGNTLLGYSRSMPLAEEATDLTEEKMFVFL